MAGPILRKLSSIIEESLFFKTIFQFLVALIIWPKIMNILVAFLLGHAVYAPYTLRKRR